MKLRPSSVLVPSVALMLTALPAALTAAGLGALPLAERASFAQGAPPPAPSDGVTEIARQRYQEGVKDFDAGKYEEARAAFLQAYALKRAPAVLLNIALSELRSSVNHADEAGAHFQQFLREATTASPEQRATAEKGIADAKKRAGTILVTVDVAGADVSIDGTSVGKAPLADPVFVKPGKHTVFAQLQGHTAAVVIDVKVGASVPANLTTGATAAPLPEPPPPATPPPATPPPGGVGPGTGATSAPPSQGTGAGPAQDTAEGESFSHWYKRKPIAWVGTGVAGVGFLTGFIASIAAGAASGKVADDARQIKEHDADPKFLSSNPERRKNICGDKDTGAGALPAYANACGVLRGDVASYNTSVAFAVTGWVLFGVGAVGTAVYAAVDWKRAKAPPATGSAPRLLAVTPLVSPTYQGIGVAGSF